MRILIVDDSKENLEAAKQATANFPEHEFHLTNSAKEAIAALAETDAVITDLFFPDEGHKDGGELDEYYGIYRRKMDISTSSAFGEVKRSYYDRVGRNALECLNDTEDFLEDGTIRSAVERLVRHFENRGNKEYAEQYREVLQNLPVPRFPYGGALMLRAKELDKRLCLVSDIHRHAGGYTDAPSALEGMLILLPLMARDIGILSVAEVEYDGAGSKTYLGSDEIRRAGKGKTDSATWTEAIRRILAQTK